jgi:CheY-like chemotaxis protein
MARPRILVVDDNEVVLAVYERDLERWGYEVHSAVSIAAGREVALRVRPDLALVDLNLPDGDGLSLAAELRRSLGDGAPPVLVVSASYDEEATGDRPEVVRYLPKGVAPERLRRLLAAAIARERLSLVPSIAPR